MTSWADQHSWGQGRRNVMILPIFACVHWVYGTFVCECALLAHSSWVPNWPKALLGSHDLKSPQKKRLGVHITHPNPPAGTWATAAFRKAPWAPAACGGKGLPPGATSNWRPRSNAGEPGLSGRRRKSAEDRAPQVGPGSPRIGTTGRWRRASLSRNPPSVLPSLPLREETTISKCEGVLCAGFKAEPLPWHFRHF